MLVTGGAGFIGSHLVDRLIQEGYSVAVVDNLSTGKKKNLNPEAKFYKLDIQSGGLARVFRKEKPEVLFHLAAQMDVRRSVADPCFDAESNIVGMLNLLEQAVQNGVRRVIFASSGGAVYGEQEVFPAPESHPTHPLSPYGVSKRTGEHYLYYYQKVCGLEYTALRYANVYGPRQDPLGEAGVVAIFTQKMLKGEQPIINGNGMQTRDFVFLEDVIEANMAAVRSRGSDFFNVGTGIETSVNDLFRMLAQITGAQVKEMHGQEKKGEQLRSSLDCQKIYKTLDWESHVSFQEGLTKTVDYFRGQAK
jgi:UDP-glucose 4-epimerase